MARTRSIKPGFFDNELLGSLTPLTRLLFIGLWTQADRAGRLEDRPRKLKKTVLGYDDVSADTVDEMLQALADNGFIIRYEAAGEKYIQVVNFVKHQNPHMKEKPSEIPPPSDYDEHPHAPRESRQDEPEPEEDREDPPEPEAPEEPPEDEEDTPKEPQKEERGIVERRFELFWSAYPKKKSKGDALKAFKAIKPNEELFSKIMDGVARGKTSNSWTKENGRYIPYPATWLRAMGWEDEEEDLNNGKARGHPERSNAPTAPAASISGFKPAD